MGEQAGAREPYVDRPQPERSYAAPYAALAVVLAALFVFVGLLPLVGVLASRSLPVMLFGLVLVPLAACLVAVQLYALFHVEYVVSDEELHIRKGRASGRVALADIRRIRRMRATRKLHHDGSFRNRWHQLLEVSRPWRRPYALSPSDVDAFVAELERRAGRNLRWPNEREDRP